MRVVVSAGILLLGALTGFAQPLQVPVVFHVVYNTPAQNISDAQLLSQLEVLNEDFNLQNADTVLIPGPFKQAAASANIAFCLAKTDPSGNASTGITHTFTTVTTFTPGPNAVKFNQTGGHTAWPTTQYLNIWVCKMANGQLGYSQFPGGAASTDGVVLDYRTVGRAPANPFPGPFNLGRVGTRQVAHWFYIVQAGMSAACSAGTDGLPPQAGSIGGCPSFPHSTGCANAPFGAQYMNFMQDTDDACRHMFTAQQVARMQAIIYQSRPGLLNTYHCNATQGSGAISFTRQHLVNDSVRFRGYAYVGPLAWSWQFPGASPAVSTSRNPVVTYPSAGIYNFSVTLGQGVNAVTYNHPNSIEIYEHALSGKVFYDLNLNGTQDQGEPGKPGVAVTVTPGGNMVFTDNTGKYTVFTNAAAATVSIQPILYHTLSPASHTVTFNSTGQWVTGQDFALQPLPGQQDLVLQATATPFRPGFPAFIQADCHNTGTVPVNATLELQLDPLLVIGNLPAGVTLSGANTLQWPVPNLQPNEKRTLSGTFVYVPVTAALGTPITNILTLLPVAGDLTPANNQLLLNSTVTGSFDPNDKQVSLRQLNPAQVAAAVPLDYRIRFQNTGTDTAFTVIIRDTLSADLDETTLELTGSSHASQATFNSQSRLLEWRFPNILLPDSNRNEAGSHGYVSYRVRPRTTLQPGGLILNSAFIYFDFNAPVQTNTTFTEAVVFTAASGTVPQPAWSVFPNPASEEVSISGLSGSEPAELLICNVLGQTVKKQALQPVNQRGSAVCNVQDLPQGLYLLRVVQGREGREFRIVKQ